MRILVSINHPAHVHLYKNFIWEMEKRGHEISIVAREKEVTYYLLDTYGFEYNRIATHQSTFSRKIYDFLRRWVRTHRICREFKPDITVGVGEFYFSQVGKLLGFPSIVLTDTEHTRIDAFLTFPFATRVLTPSCFGKDVGDKHVRYSGYHELAYLHPGRYTPDPSVLGILGVEKDEKYIIMRFVSWLASHDVGHSGIGSGTRMKAVKEFSRHGKVFITSEAPLPPELEEYRISIPPEKMHDALNYASLYVGEGATMASECACLGTPAIYVSDLSLGYVDEEEREYGLIRKSSNNDDFIRYGLEILRNEDTREKWKQKHNRMLEDKIDVTAFLVDYIENFGN